MNMNKCIVSLRDLKVAVIDEIQCLVQELKSIQSTFHISKHIPIPRVPQIHPEEVPEKRFHYDEEILKKFKRQRMKIQEPRHSHVEQIGSGISGRGFLKISSGKDGDVTMTTRDSLSRSSRASVFSMELPKPTEFEKPEPTEVELEIMKRDEIKHLYMQQYLTDRVRGETVSI